MTRYLYLTRHGDADPWLTETGREQATLLGRRLKDVPISKITHGPLERTTQTAQLIAEQIDVPVQVSEAAGDFVPYLPVRDELPEESADLYLEFLGERKAEKELAQLALDEFTRGTEETQHELVVTHNFLIGWLVTAALDAPSCRWLTLNHSNAGLTVIRYAPGRPAHLLCFNDVGHLLAGLHFSQR